MNDKTTLIGTAAFTVFFLISGILNIMDNLVIKVLLVGGFSAILINIIMVNSKEDANKKNLPK